VAEQPLERVDEPCELCAHAGLVIESPCATGLTGDGQRGEMLFSFRRICSGNHAVRAMGNILVYFYH